ncbi:MAG: non-canonical purine NTP pyrophosphatase, partial [Bacteroidota bacterium]
ANLPCFADDTGLEVDALDGAPGVISARYAGPERDAQANMAKLLNELGDNQNRLARFRTVIAYHRGGENLCFEGQVEGNILHRPQGEGGFGYDPIFQPIGSDLSFAEFTAEDKNAISHRGRAVRKFADFILNPSL